MKIKAVCEHTGLSDRAVRLYIDSGLLSPDKTENYAGRRSFDFSQEDLSRLNRIAALRAAGFSIAQIKDVQSDPQSIPQIVAEVTEKQKKKLISNGIVKMLRSENRKLIFGLETTSNRPIGRDRSRHEAAQLLKECGYVVIKGSMTAYYSDEMDRYSDVEQLAVANGFRLELWP